MDGTIRHVQHLIMLSILPAQSANEPAPFAPGDSHRLHVAILPRSRRLAPEEPPPLAVRPTPSLSSFLHRPRVLAQRRESFRVGPSELRQSEAGDEGDRALDVSGVPVLDDFLELSPQGRWQFHRARLGFARGPHESSHRVGAGREPVGPLEAVEERLLFGGEAHSKESNRGSVGSGFPHAFNRNLTHIYVLCNLVKHRGRNHPPTRLGPPQLPAPPRSSENRGRAAPRLSSLTNRAAARSGRPVSHDPLGNTGYLASARLAVGRMSFRPIALPFHRSGVRCFAGSDGKVYHREPAHF